MKEQFRKAIDSWEDIKVADLGNVARFSEIMDFSVASKGESINAKGIRIAGVLEKRDGNWVFVQYHFSIPVAGQAVEY